MRKQPRDLLRQVGNLQLVEIADDYCCGSAGTYNAEHPEPASELGARKAQAVLATAADVVASGNIGCLTQIQSSLPANGPLALHTMQVLDRAYRGLNPAEP